MAWLNKRGSLYYIKYWHVPSNSSRRISTGTSTYQIAKEKLRQFEGALARGDDSSLPTRTSIPDALTAYVAHIRAVKTAKSAQTDIYYLRDAFGPVCDAVTAEQAGRFTLFSIVDALTRIAGEYQHAGDRTEIDQKASALLALAAPQGV